MDLKPTNKKKKEEEEEEEEEEDSTLYTAQSANGVRVPHQCLQQGLRSSQLCS